MWQNASREKITEKLKIKESDREKFKKEFNNRPLVICD